ncbi:hypothetical protein XELAEV_18000561mg [Xenopus laevis]|nr:hypothetical protein XELAEV_18000561mg [Xenopus laevis]
MSAFQTMILDTPITVLSSPLSPRCLSLPPIAHKNNGIHEQWSFFPGKDRAPIGILSRTKGNRDRNIRITSDVTEKNQKEEKKKGYM